MATIVGNIFRSIFGTGMNDKEKEASAFNAAEADKARAFEERMYQEYSSPQALMNQYKEAGINPTLVAGGSMPSPSVGGAAASAETSNGPDIGSLLSMLFGAARTVSEIGVNKSQSDLNEANAGLARSNTTGKDIENDYASVRNALNTRESEARISAALQSVKESISRVSLNSQNEALIGSQRVKIDSDVQLNDVQRMVGSLTVEKMRIETSHLDSLLSAQNALYSAQSRTEVAKQAELYQSAALKLVESQKEQGLISNGYYDELCASVHAQTEHVKTLNSGDEVRNAMLNVDAKWQKANKWIGATKDILVGVGSATAGVGTGLAKGAEAMITYRGR